MVHLDNWEKDRGHYKDGIIGTPTNRNVQLLRRPIACPHCQKECGNAGGLGIHKKRINGKSEALFKSTRCSNTFKSEATRKNHERTCTGEKMMGTSKKCRTCQKVVTAKNFARHRKLCSSNQTYPQEPARVYKPKYVPCPGCQDRYQQQTWLDIAEYVAAASINSQRKCSTPSKGDAEDGRRAYPLSRVKAIKVKLAKNTKKKNKSKQSQQKPFPALELAPSNRSNQLVFKKNFCKNRIINSSF